MTSADDEKLISSKQAAAWLGVTECTLRIWRCTNRYPDLKFVRIGSRTIKYRVGDIRDFISSSTVGPKS